MSDRRRTGRESANRFSDHVEALLTGNRPHPGAVSDELEARMAQAAAELAATNRDRSAVEPDAAFVEQLRLRMRRADEAIAAVSSRPGPARPSGSSRRWRLSRRELLQAGLGAAAGVAAGAVGVSLLGRSAGDDGGVSHAPPLVAGAGFWTEVGRLDELPAGSAMRFSTASFEGYVVNDRGAIRALSATCTHMGCTLQFRADRQDLRCPCHGASFGLDGRLANGRDAWSRADGYAGDERAYPIDLPDLARPSVKIEDERIWVWTARA